VHKKFLVVGAGAWGTAIANVLSKKNNNVYLWARDLKLSNQINKSKINKKYYKNFKLSRKLKSISGNFNANEYHYIFYVLPASAFDNFCDDYLKNQKINELIICSKGISKSGDFISNLIMKKLNLKNYHFLSGPSFADEVLYGKPTGLSLSSNKINRNIGNIFKDTNIRIYYSESYKTLEFLGILKNIYAIGAGVIDATSLGQNARAAYITRCIVEIKSMLISLNLNTNMIYSLGGIGDLILSCSSKKSRNYNFGLCFEKKNKFKTLNRKTIEGINSCLNIKNNIKININKFPIINSVIKIINGSPPKKEVKILLNRKFKNE
jgi:glycerol-3-phosphate dehydrogenase (NAD(P)+)